MTGKEVLYSNFEKHWVVGFTDGEGCFNLDVHVHRTMRWGLQMQPEFSIVQHERDKALLENLIPFFGCGTVAVNRKDATSTRYHFRVKNVKDLHEKVVPFFEQNQLKTVKSNDFQLFKQIVERMAKGEHIKSAKGFLEVIDLGVELSKRSSTRTSTKAAKVAKRSAVEVKITELRAKLLADPSQ